MLFIELYITDCDLKNQRFQCDDSSQILLVESKFAVHFDSYTTMASGLAGHLLQSFRADLRIQATVGLGE